MSEVGWRAVDGAERVRGGASPRIQSDRPVSLKLAVEMWRAIAIFTVEATFCAELQLV